MNAGSNAAAVFRSLAHARHTCRRFQPQQTIPEATLRDILDTTLRSPSSFNLQPTQLVLVRDPETKAQLADTAMLGAGNVYRTRDCAALAVFLADLQPTQGRVDRILDLEANGVRHPGYRAILPRTASFLLGEGHLATWLKQISTTLLSHPENPTPGIDPVQAWAYKNTALMVQSYVLAATSHQLATAIMEGYDPRRYKEILRIPDRYDIPMVVATGYEYQDDKDSTTVPTPRLPLNEVVFDDAFGAPIHFSQATDAVETDTLSSAERSQTNA